MNCGFQVFQRLEPLGPFRTVTERTRPVGASNERLVIACQKPPDMSTQDFRQIAKMSADMPKRGLATSTRRHAKITPTYQKKHVPKRQHLAAADMPKQSPQTRADMPKEHANMPKTRILHRHVNFYWHAKSTRRHVRTDPAGIISRGVIFHPGARFRHVGAPDPKERSDVK